MAKKMHFEKKEPKREERRESKMPPIARAKMERREGLFKSGGKVSKKKC